jgi:alpha-tubulin suppressor-like RCC1 family protein
MKRILLVVCAIVVIFGVCAVSLSDRSPFDAVNAASRLSRSTQLSLGGDHSCALLTSGELKCWGANQFGQLGLGISDDYGDDPGEMGSGLPAVNINSTAKSISAGYKHTCAIRNDDSTVCWGENYYGELGIGNMNNIGDDSGEMGSDLVAVDLGTNHAVALSAGLEFTCAIVETGDVKCWGNNTNGQLGVSGEHGRTSESMGEGLPAIDLGLGRTAKAISTGRLHACAILDTDEVKCWGDDAYGQLGSGDTIDQVYPIIATDPTVDLGTGRTAKAIAVGAFHTCAILDNDTLKCWGYNVMGQLGTDSTDTLGDDAGEMGDALAAINLGTGRTAVAVAVSKRGDLDYTCAVLDNGQVKCWGANDMGQLGFSPSDSFGDAAGEMASLGALNLGTGTTVTKIAIGAAHNCFILNNTNIKCFGHGNNGKLGYGSWDGYIASGDDLPVVDLDGVVASPTATSTATPTASHTRTPTKTPSKTPTKTLTRSKTNTPTKTLTRSKTKTPTKTLTRSKTKTPTKTPTRSRTATKIKTP